MWGGAHLPTTGFSVVLQHLTQGWGWAWTSPERQDSPGLEGTQEAAWQTLATL